MKTGGAARYNPPGECYSSARRQVYGIVTRGNQLPIAKVRGLQLIPKGVRVWPIDGGPAGRNQPRVHGEPCDVLY